MALCANGCSLAADGELWKQKLALGEQLEERGQYQEAEKQLVAALEEARRSPTGERYVAAVMVSLATLYLDMGRFGEAERLGLEALRTAERTFGPETPGLLKPLYYLGMLYMKRGQYAKAELQYRRAVNIADRHLQVDDPQRALALAGLADVLTRRKRFEQAFVANSLAVLYLAAGRRAESIAPLEKAIRVLEAAFGDQDPRLMRPLANLGWLQTKLGDMAAARAALQRAVAVSQHQLCQADPLVPRILSTYAALQRKAGHEREARELEQRSAAVRARQSHVDPSRHTVSVEDLLAGTRKK
jgi:tetratricopeptide (TPR) repeat protein